MVAKKKAGVGRKTKRLPGMNRYSIVDWNSGERGTWRAKNEKSAIQSYVRAAGFKTIQHAARAANTTPATFVEKLAIKRVKV